MTDRDLDITGFYLRELNKFKILEPKEENELIIKA